MVFLGLGLGLCAGLGVANRMEKGKDMHLKEEERDTAEIDLTSEPEAKHQSLVLIGSLKTSRPFNAFALNSIMKSESEERLQFQGDLLEFILFSVQR